MTVTVVSRPMEIIVLGVSAFLKYPNLDGLKLHAGVLENFIEDGIHQIFFLHFRNK